MIHLEVGKIYVLTVHAGGPFDLLGTMKDRALDGDGYFITKIRVLTPDPNVKGQLMIAPLQAVNPLVRSDEAIFSKTAIRMVYEPKDDLLAKYMKSTTGILPANQMPPASAEAIMQNLNLIKR